MKENNTWNFSEGEILLINKPQNWTSFDVVAKIRNTIGIKKVGHSGTLDPLATGLLLIATGKSTKKIPFLTDCDKKYKSSITFGATTATYDAETPQENIVSQDLLDKLTPEIILENLKPFLGEQTQIPPIYSAVKIGGRPAYELARKGIEIEMKTREIIIKQLDLLSYDPITRTADLMVHCSKGTYIRTLAHDLGRKIGVGAFLSGLVRTEIGEYKLENAFELADFIKEVKAIKERI